MSPRYAFSLLALGAGVAAQQPPVLTTTPPVRAQQFGPAAFGGSVTEVAQLTMVRDAAAGNWYVTATVRLLGRQFLTGWSGRATGSPGNYALTANNDFANVPTMPANDYFAFNVSSDLKVLVFDGGPFASPQVYVRSATNVPFTPFGSIPGVTGYVDSQVGNTIASWDGTVGRYEFIYTWGVSVRRAPLILAAPSTVTLGAPVTMASSFAAQHSPSPMRENTGLPSEWGTCRALMHSRNMSSADAFFRSSLVDETLVSVPSLQVYDDWNWKSNPGHIGGSMFWAYLASGSFEIPLQLDTVCMSSAHPPAAGGMLTICAWAPPKATPQFGFVMLGTLDPVGLDLPALGITGKLGLGPTSLTFLPTQLFDPDLGEMSYTFAVGRLGMAAIHMQVGNFDVASNKIYLGNNAIIKAL